MCQPIDCLLIGHNQVDFAKYERQVRSMGAGAPAYRDLSMNFVVVDGVPMTLREIWNAAARLTEPRHTRLQFSDNFSATIGYLGSFLRRRELSFEFIESFQDEKDRLRSLLATGPVLTVAITTTYYTDPEPIAEIVDVVRATGTGARIIVGGPFVSTLARASADDRQLSYVLDYIGADVYVNNPQGEATLVQFINALKDGRAWSDLDNLIVKTPGGYVRRPMQPENNDLARNRVDWTLFAERIGKYANLRSAISYPFACAFCSFPEHAGEYRLMPVEALEAELNELADRDTMRGVMFVDDTFNIPPRRFRQVLEMLIRNQYGFKWFGNIRCQYLDRETVDLMKESGCNVVFLGLESGSDTVLGHMNKVATKEQYLNGIALLKDAGIVTFGSFVIGFPGETTETVVETIRFLDRSGIDFYRANLWYCERITPVWRTRDRFALDGDGFEWRHMTMTSQEAAALVSDIFFAVDRPIWVPVFDFDIVGVWQLLSQGYSIADVKSILRVFNAALREQMRGRGSVPKRRRSVVNELAAVLDRVSPSSPVRMPPAFEAAVEFRL